jgi:hypothetical protein
LFRPAKRQPTAWNEARPDGHSSAERRDDKQAIRGVCDVRFLAGENAISTAWKARAMRVSDHGPVMLHLRACHASKAAILTIPAILLPVENRSPA